MPTRRRNPAVLASATIAGAAFAILGIVLASTPDDDDLPPVEEVAATPTTSAPPAEPAPEPEPEPEPEPVSAALGEVVLEDLSVTGSGLYGSSHPSEVAVAIDQAAVDAFRDAVVGSLDAHLLDQQAGGAGTLTTDAPLVLATPHQPVASATVTLRIGVRGTPEWALADVDVALADGGAEHHELVFEPGEPPRLLAASR